MKKREAELWANGQVVMRYDRWLQEMDVRSSSAPGGNENNLTLGYVTEDVSPP